MGIFHWTIVVYQRESPAKLTYPLKIVDWKVKFPHFLVKKGGAFWGTSVSLPEGILSFTKHVMTLGHQKPEAYRPTGHWCNTTCWVDVCCWAWNGHTAPEEIPPPHGNLGTFMNLGVTWPIYWGPIFLHFSWERLKLTCAHLKRTVGKIIDSNMPWIWGIC